MSKVNYGILSLNVFQKANNWGSLLQSWALQQILDKFGVSNEIIAYKPEICRYNHARYPILWNFPFHVKRFMRMIVNDIREFNTYTTRDDKFKLFISEHYRTSEYCDSKNVEKLNYSGYIVGSDIVWHEAFWHGFERAYFCDYPNMRQMRNVAYAPSMQDSGFSPENEPAFQEKLKNFEYISVREPSQRAYVQRFTDKEVFCVLDPTLLLDSTDYEPLVAARSIADPYMLVYTVSSNDKLLEYAQSYATQHNLRIVQIKCISEKAPKLQDAILENDAGVEEWLSLIKYADVVFTNSFHACIFSIIFKKEFFATYREFGKYKVIDLMNTLGIENYCSVDEAYQYSGAPIDYVKVYQRLEERQRSSLEYLKNALQLH